jgi:hypothetical protein
MIKGRTRKSHFLVSFGLCCVLLCHRLVGHSIYYTYGCICISGVVDFRIAVVM